MTPLNSSVVVGLGLVLTVAMSPGLPPPPLGLDLYMPVPGSNPMSKRLVTLGRRLFDERRLSRDRRVACSSCHEPKRGFSSDAAAPKGVFARRGRRNAPALINRGYGRIFFWDGRTTSLEEQVLQPIQNPDEMDLTLAEASARVMLDQATIARALASYVRSIRSGNSRFDRYTAGQTDALTAVELAGLRVFRGKGNCTACHTGPNFTDERLHNTGVSFRDGRFDDDGHAAVSKKGADRGAFKTPTLREVARTAPYMHDGSLTTLEEVIDFYDRGGRPNPYLDPEIRPLRFATDERAALAAFLRVLSGQVREGWK
jgi:cytochrome c peroxidase